jgi:Na+-transporting methylmalonyl-CoA/oxaloacetate decarboxylase gamma subunit
MEVIMFIIISNVPWMENFATFSDKFFIGVTMTLVGVSIVVLVLALISLFVSFLSRLINRGGAKSGKQPVAAVSAAPGAAAAKAEPVPAVSLSTGSDAGEADQQALIAVLAAAVAAFSAESAPRSSAGFIIRRVRRV